jgi:hypothetical protein
MGWWICIGLDNTQWLPWHLEQSWDPDDDMRQMKSAFGHRYMIMGGWGTSFYPRDPSWRAPENPADDEAEDQAEVQLEEYHSWSRGSWDRGSAKSRDRPAPRDRTPLSRGQKGTLGQRTAGGARHRIGSRKATS